MDHLFKCLLREEEETDKILSQIQAMSLSSQEEIAFKNNKNCHICEQPLGADRVRDHDHLIGTYRGAAHSECNLQYQFRKGKRCNFNYYIPVIAYNSSNYDLHYIMSVIGKFRNKKMSCIPNNMEKHIIFSFGDLRFIES